MFSSDEAKIRIAELKAKGDRGTIQRLRQAVGDAAAIMDKMAEQLEAMDTEGPWRKEFAKQLRRGAGHLRGLRRTSAPRGS